MKNKKGFTLVELLAVIVVLAIIMIIAIPQVMDSMNAAKKNSFKIYAQKVLNTAITQHQAEALTLSGTPNNCYKVSSLMGNGKGNYVGYVIVNNGTFTVFIKDGSYYVKDAAYADLEKTTNTSDTKTIQSGIPDPDITETPTGYTCS